MSKQRTWTHVDTAMPAKEEEVLFLGEYNSELFHCYGYWDGDVDGNRWLDVSATGGIDCEPKECFTVRYWMRPPTPPDKRERGGVPEILQDALEHILRADIVIDRETTLLAWLGWMRDGYTPEAVAALQDVLAKERAK